VRCNPYILEWSLLHLLYNACMLFPIMHWNLCFEGFLDMGFFCDRRFLGLTCFVGVYVCIYSHRLFLTS